MKYKNLYFAYSIEIMFGLITSLLIIISGPMAISFLAFFAIRPFILKSEKLSPQDDYWYKSFRLGKLALIILSIIIIFFYLTSDFLLSNNVLNNYKERIIILIPLYLLVHGILGLIGQYEN